MYSNNLHSPLRYPGGKASFAPFITEVLAANSLKGGHYFEPYAGGAGVALTLLFQGHVGHIHINDFDPAIFAFWEAVTKHPADLLCLLAESPITIDEWFRWRAVLRDGSNESLVTKGFATLFMNRTNRSGILNAGVIGGKDQAGKYRLDARFRKDVIAARISAIASKSNQISVYCVDTIDLLKQCEEILPPDSLIYLDPPYYAKGKGLYRNFYEHDDHMAIASALQRDSFKWPWVASYDKSDQILKMYEGTRLANYGLNYTAQTRYVGSEVMFFSRNLQLPLGGSKCLPLYFQ